MLQLQAVTSREFHAAIADVSTAISSCGGWVTEHQFYSNSVAMVAFELPVKNLTSLMDRLRETHITIRDTALPTTSPLPEIRGQINITFMHQHADIRRTIHAFDL